MQEFLPQMKIRCTQKKGKKAHAEREGAEKNWNFFLCASAPLRERCLGLIRVHLKFDDSQFA